MNKVVLGKTGIETPQNAFGALPIQRVSDEYAVFLLRLAYESGFTFFDTARSYSDSERKIGLAFSSLGIRDKITIATKTASVTPEGIYRDIETSLENLKTDYIDIYQLHNPSFCPVENDGSGVYETLAELKKKGKIKHLFEDKKLKETKTYSKKYAALIISIISVVVCVLTIAGFLFVRYKFSDTDLIKQWVDENYFLGLVPLRSHTPSCPPDRGR